MKRATGQEQRGIMGEWETEDRTPQRVSQHTPHDAETLDKAPRVFQAGLGQTGHLKATHRVPGRLQMESPWCRDSHPPSCWGGPSLNRLDDATWQAHVSPLHTFCHGRV